MVVLRGLAATTFALAAFASISLTASIAVGPMRAEASSPAAAVASRAATGRTRMAILRAVDPGYPGPQRCLLVRVTTKDGGNWATVGFNPVNSCAQWGFNGVNIAHRVRGRWRNVTSGSAMIPCGRYGIPPAVRRDLGLPCR
jgi:hypothetical protein